MLYAVYRALYGHDFFEASVRSVAAVADKIIAVVDHAPHMPGIRRHVYGRAQQRMEDSAVAFADEVWFNHYESPENQFTRMSNEIVKPRSWPDEFMFLDVDMVWRDDQLQAALKEFRGKGYRCADTRQVEIWRGFRYRVPERPQRAGVTLWNVRGLDHLPETGHLGRVPQMPRLQAFVHNLGFAVSPETMRCKHEIACASALDTPPNRDWYEKKWLGWTPGMTDLEISIGYEHDIPHLDPYDPDELPEEVRKCASL